MNRQHCQVAVIGAGPAGLALATELKVLGVDHVVLLERETTAGGIPRHCGHSPFGMREFHRVLSGRDYTQRLVNRAQRNGVDIRLNTTVVDSGKNGVLHLSTPAGEAVLLADKIVFCTGARELPRSTRLISGSRPPGVMTTGALQSMVYLYRQRPFSRPVIIGSELIAFSALLTCRHAGIRPVAMIETGSKINCWRLVSLLPRFLGTMVLADTRLVHIGGQERVSDVSVKRPGRKLETIECDGVIFSGDFIGESSLAKKIDLEFDANGLCSDPNFFACGNFRLPLKTAGQCWQQGRMMAGLVKATL